MELSVCIAFIVLLAVLGVVLFVLDKKPPTAYKVLFLGALLMVTGLIAGLFVSSVVAPAASFLTNMCLAIASVGGNLMAAAALFKTQINQASLTPSQASPATSPISSPTLVSTVAQAQSQSPQQLAGQLPVNPLKGVSQQVPVSPSQPVSNSTASSNTP